MKKIILGGIPFLLLLSFWMGSFMELTKGEAEIGREIAINLALVESNVGLSIKGNIDKMKGLATYIGLNPELTVEEINHYIDEILRGEDNIISNIGVFEDTTAIYLYPYEENKAMDHIDLQELPPFREDALRVKNDFETVITPPAELIQGGQGIIIRLPILKENHTYWGQIGYMMRYEDIVESLGINASEYGFKIEQINESNSQVHVVYQEGFVEDAIVDSVLIDLPTSDWRVSASNATRFEPFSTIFWFLLIFGIVFFVITRNVIKDMQFSQFMMNGLVESSQDIVIISDRNNKLVDCSAQFLEILKKEKIEVLGNDLSSFLEDGNNIATIFEGIQKLGLNSNSPDSLEKIMVNDEERYYSFRRLNMRNDRGMIILGHDVNEIKKQEIETEKARKVADETARIQSRFLANMSHEIRTPMNGILGMIELSMLEDVGGKVIDYLDVAKGSARSLLTILNDILDYSKLEVDKMTISSEPFELNRLVNDIKTLFDYTAKEKNLVFTVDVDEKLPVQLVSDSIRIRQVLTNLLSNAFKFTSSGSVFLRATLLEQKDDLVKVQFSVKDTGIGIHEDNAINLFKRFDQLDQSITKNYGGSGLGLAISKGLVELMGGSIQCISEVDIGSLFLFELTVAYNNEEVVTKEVNLSTIIKGQAEGRSVLVVDDDLVNRKVMSAVIGKLGHRVTLAENGQEAIKYCEEQPYDIVFMDINMPILDGYQAVKVIRNIEKYGIGEIPIISLTAFALDGDKEESLASGFDDYLSKPVEIHQVASSIAEWTS